MPETGTAKGTVEIVGFYLQRWQIEEYFRALKSDRRSEFLLFRTADRPQRANAINAVITCCIMVMTQFGWQVPDCGLALLFTDHELDFLRDYALEHDMRAPERLDDAILLVAHLGWYRDRRHDPEPEN